MKRDESKLIPIKEASEMIGVTIETLRRWDEAGKLRAIRNDESNMKTILNDKIILNLFSKETGKKYSNVNLFWDNVYSNLTNTERLELIFKIIKKGLPLNDLMIISVAELLNISSDTVSPYISDLLSVVWVFAEAGLMNADASKTCSNACKSFMWAGKRPTGASPSRSESRPASKRCRTFESTPDIHLLKSNAAGAEGSAQRRQRFWKTSSSRSTLIYNSNKRAKSTENTKSGISISNSSYTTKKDE
jgi:hypothetical protein